MVGATARTLLANALKRRQELDEEREALDSLIATYQQLLATDQRKKVPSDQLDLYRQASARAEHRERIEEILDAARRIMIEASRPLKRGELVGRLEQKGFVLPGADKSKVLGTNLWRSGRFQAVEGQGYWPNDIELPAQYRHD